MTRTTRPLTAGVRSGVASTIRLTTTAAVVGVLSTAAALAMPTVARADPGAPSARVSVAVASTSFTSPEHGWVLGAVPCHQGRCTVVVQTATAGRSWTRVHGPAVPLAGSSAPGVNRVHFADDRNGWVFAPQLQVTHDGGRTWTRLAVPGGGRQVAALTSGGGVVYAVVSSCVVGDPTRCPKPAAVWRSPVAANHWTRVPIALSAQDQPALSASGRTAYVVLVDPSVTAEPVFRATTDGGAHWSPRPSPCDAATGERLKVDAVTATRVALLCSTDTQPGIYTKRVFVSADTARTTTRRGTAPAVDQPQGLAVSGQVIAIDGVGGASVIQRSPDGGRSWRTAYAAPPAGMNDLTLDGATGAVVRGTAELPGGVGQLLLSHDTGRHWAVTPVRVPAE